jgi:hypothetical protein
MVQATMHSHPNPVREGFSNAGQGVGEPFLSSNAGTSSNSTVFAPSDSATASDKVYLAFRIPKRLSRRSILGSEETSGWQQRRTSHRAWTRNPNPGIARQQNYLSSQRTSRELCAVLNRASATMHLCALSLAVLSLDLARLLPVCTNPSITNQLTTPHARKSQKPSRLPILPQFCFRTYPSFRQQRVTQLDPRSYLSTKPKFSWPFHSMNDALVTLFKLYPSRRYYRTTTEHFDYTFSRSTFLSFHARSGLITYFNPNHGVLTGLGPV